MGMRTQDLRVGVGAVRAESAADTGMELLHDPLRLGWSSACRGAVSERPLCLGREEEEGRRAQCRAWTLAGRAARAER